MNINRKVPAFTLMEVTISMLIAAIAIVIAFTAYKVVSGSYLDFSRKQQVISDFTTVDKLLKQDFIQAKLISRSENGFAIQMQNGIVDYQFNEEYLLRNQYSLRIDTFKMKVQHLSCLFEGTEVTAGDRLDQFSFSTQAGGLPVSLLYYKLYSAQDLLP